MVNGFNTYHTTGLHRDSPMVAMPPNSNASPRLSESSSHTPSYRSPMQVERLSPATISGDGTPLSSFALQDVIRQFRDQPELLQLVLQSKVEEDKRRTEEAKLRAKEIDLYLQQRESQDIQGLALRPLRFSREDSQRYSVDTDGIGKPNSPPNRADLPSQDMQNLSPYGRLQPSPPHSRHVFSSSSNSREHTPPSTSLAPRHTDYRRHSAVELPPFRYNSPVHPLSSNSSESDFKRRRLSMDQAIGTTSHPESPPADASMDANELNSLGDGSKRQRKRREMQSITKVVETRDFPYNDEYLWKNNGMPGQQDRNVQKEWGIHHQVPWRTFGRL
ncbi:hypothetical protein NQZ79_g4263 [Umbelopsis isabellina]|nr:hypothetical protein NQZ79_g4263 [Umbelopsis isabellina]